MENNYYRHGDVLLRRVERPKDVKIEKENVKKHTIAFGEATGHHHTIYAEKINALSGFDERKYVEIVGKATLKHQEHKALSIDSGTYEIVIEHEHDYFSEETRRVVD